MGTDYCPGLRTLSQRIVVGLEHSVSKVASSISWPGTGKQLPAVIRPYSEDNHNVTQGRGQPNTDPNFHGQQL